MSSHPPLTSERTCNTELLLVCDDGADGVSADIYAIFQNLELDSQLTSLEAGVEAGVHGTLFPSKRRRR